MEREKQRQADRDRVMKERDEKRRQEKLLEQSVLSQFEPTSLIPAKSKFVCNFFPFSSPFINFIRFHLHFLLSSCRNVIFGST